MNTWVKQYVNGVVDAARLGKTSHLIPYQSPEGTAQIRPQTLPWMTPPTKEEFLEILQQKFPGCKVSYEEMWVSIAIDKQELKRGILVDWS